VDGVGQHGGWDGLYSGRGRIHFVVMRKLST
jgi:hypothetical protein